MFAALSELLSSQSDAWSDGSLVLDGGRNHAGSRDKRAFVEFIESPITSRAIFGVREAMPLLRQAELFALSSMSVTQTLVAMLRDEQMLFSHVRLPETSLIEIADCFVRSFDAPAFWTNTRFREGGSSWNPVTNYSRDTLVVGIDEQKIGYWLTCDDE